MTASPPRILFLPGAGGSPLFWKPVAALLPAHWSKHRYAWPGLGDETHDPAVRSMDDLMHLVARDIDEPVDLVAQSMGGAVASRLAIQRPRLVRRLVLVATSAGIDMVRLGARDWRDAYRAEYPGAVDWITRDDAAAPIAVERITAPSLLIWGETDPISPPAVGHHLAQRMPEAVLHIIDQGGHDLALQMPNVVADLIRDHLES